MSFRRKISSKNVLADPNPASRPNSLQKEKVQEFVEWDMHLPKFSPFGASKRKLDFETVKNTFTSPNASDFMVRDVGYLDGTKKTKNGKKAPSADAAYTIVGVNVFKAKKNLEHISQKVEELKSYLAIHGSGEPSKDGLPEFLVVTWLFKSFWSRDYTCVVHLFKKTVDIVAEREANNGNETGFERAFKRFMDGDDKVKSSKFKFAFTIHDGPNTLIKTVNAMGGQKPVLIGKALKTKFFEGNNYLEICMDVGSSKIASMLNSVILKASAGIVVSTMWSLEATEEEELPERVIGAVKWRFIHVKEVFIELDEEFKPLQK